MEEEGRKVSIPVSTLDSAAGDEAASTSTLEAVVVVVEGMEDSASTAMAIMRGFTVLAAVAHTLVVTAAGWMAKLRLSPVPAGWTAEHGRTPSSTPAGSGVWSHGRSPASFPKPYLPGRTW
jgi:hypothetical protein